MHAGPAPAAVLDDVRAVGDVAVRAYDLAVAAHRTFFQCPPSGPLRVRQTRRDQDFVPGLGRRERVLGHLERRDLLLVHAVELASAASPAPAPWYRSATVRPTSLFASFGCRVPAA